jgi:hypothetical protein
MELGVQRTMQSHFNSQTLAEILRDLYLSERIGLLRLHNGKHENVIYFDRGLIVFAESGAPDCDLGQCLIRDGKVSEGALEEAQANSADLGGVANALITRDLISKQSLSETITEIIGRTIRRTFQWERGTADFHEEAAFKGGLDGDILSTCGFTLEGILGMVGFETIHEAMMAIDSTLRMHEPPPIPVERMQLSAEQGFVLSRIDGSTTVRDLVSILHSAHEEQATRFIYGLLVMGVIEHDPSIGDGPFRTSNFIRDHADGREQEDVQERTIKQIYAQMSSTSMYEALGVSQSANLKTIERAYEELKTLFGADRLLPRIREKYRSEIAVIESRLIEVYLSLSQPASEAVAETGAQPDQADNLGVNDLLVRVEMDKTKSKIEHEKASKIADTYYAQARKAVRDSDYHNAIQYGKLAVSYNDTDARYFYLVAECQARNPGQRWLHQAENNYTKATELDPWNADYFLTLGSFYQKHGMLIRAKKQFEEALRLSPLNEQALQGLKTMS